MKDKKARFAIKLLAERIRKLEDPEYAKKKNPGEVDPRLFHPEDRELLEMLYEESWD